MTVRPIRALGDPVLGTPCRDVTSFDERLAGLVDDLLDTVRLPGRGGLAAPQIGVGLRVFSYRIDGQEGHVVNPTVILTEGEQSGEEGCLSIPHLWVECPRAMHVVVAGFDANGNALEVDGTGQMARCLQHETDHLAGVLFIDRLDRATRKEAMQTIRERALLESVQAPGRSGPSWLSHYRP